MLIQSTDGNFYGGFIQQLEGINIKEDQVYTLHNKVKTELIMATYKWFCKLRHKQTKTAVQILDGGQLIVRSAHPWSVEWIDWIPTPMHYKIRTPTPSGDFKIFVIEPTDDELDGIAKGVFSERIKVAMGGTHLTDSLIKRRLKKQTSKGVIYAI